MAPELSVVIVTYGCRDLALACLDTLAPQREDVDLEVLLVDNASTDGTLRAVAERHPWVRALPAGGNVGFAAANNLALRAVRGRFVLLLNPDTLVPEGALRRCLDELSSQPEVGMLGCKLVKLDGTLDHACKRGFPTFGASASYFAGMHRRFPSHPRFAAYVAGHLGENEAGPVDAVNGAFMLCRREAIDAVGPIDETFWMYGEDLDWCFRFWAAGWPVRYWPEVTVVHLKGGSSTSTRSWRTNRAFHGAMWLFHRKHYADARSAPFNALVWSAIHLKLALSAGRSAALRSRSRRRVGALGT